MCNRHLILAAAFVMTALSPLTARAQQTPGLMTFQGRLTDASNNPLGGSRSLVFRIFDAPAAGTQLWTETQPAVTVTNGVFTVYLGTVAALTPEIFAGASTYLEIAVDGTTLSPRERLVASPYAMSARQLEGYSAAFFVSTSAVNQSIAGVKTFTGGIVVSGGAELTGLPATPSGATAAASKAYVDGITGGGNVFASTNTFSAQQNFNNAVAVSSSLAVSGGFSASMASFTATGAEQHSVQTSSGVRVLAGGVTAPFFSGAHYGDGSALTGVGGASISAGSIDTTKLAADSVITVKILDLNVTTAKLATGAVDTAKLAADSVSTAKILDLNVTTAKIAAGAVDTSKLAADAVTGVKILNGTIDTAKLNPTIQTQLSLAGTVAAGYIDTTKLASDSVTTAKILDLNVTTAKLAAGAVDTAKLAADSVITSKILDLNVTTAKIATGAVDTAKLAADSVTGVKILDGTIDTAKLNPTIQTQLSLAGTVAAGYIDTTKLASDSVITAKILDLNVTTAKLAAGAVDTAKLAADSVITAKILDLNVTNAKIAAGAVDTSKLAADSVTGVKILNATIDTAKLNATIQTQLSLAGTVAAGYIDTAKLAADSVTGVKILNGTIDTAKLNATIQSQLLSGGNAVLKTGDFMSGQLTTESTITVKGNAFSVGASTLVVASGRVGIGTANPAKLLEVGVPVGAAPGLSGPAADFFANLAATSDLNHRNILGLWDSQAAAVGAGGGLMMGSRDGSGAYSTGAMIKALRESTGVAFNHHMGLYTRSGAIIDERMRITSGGNVGIGTNVPATLLDVNGNAQFGLGAAKSTFTATGDLNLASNADLSLTGPTAYFTAGSSVNASAFFGDGAGLTNVGGGNIAAGTIDTAKLATDSVTGVKILNGTIDTAKLNASVQAQLVLAGNAVSKSGDFMSGQLTLGGLSSMTVTGAASIGATGLSGGTLVVKSTTTSLANPVISARNNAGSEIFKIQEDGSASIGTPNTSEKLVVNGNVAVRDGSSWGSGFGRLFKGNDPNGTVFQLGVRPAGTVFELNTSYTSLPIAFLINDSEKARILTSGNLGVGTSVPETLLDINGNAQFGLGAAKSTFTATGDLNLASNADLSLTGPTAYFTAGSSVNASAFFGDGAGLTNVGGGNIAAGTIDTAKLAADSVTGVKILNGTIDTAKLNATIQTQLSLAGTVAAGYIDTAKLAADSVITSKILDLNVTTAKLAAGAVDTAKLAADSVIGAKILNATIDTAKLNATIQSQLALAGTVPNGYVDTNKLATDSVIGAKILNATIDTAKLNATIQSQLALAGTVPNGYVDTNKLATDSVIGAKILNATIDTAKLNATIQAQLATAGNAAFSAAGFWEPLSKTRAQIDLLLPTKVGQVIFASDTTLPGLCISTGTLAGDWRKMESATLGCGTGN